MERDVDVVIPHHVHHAVHGPIGKAALAPPGEIHRADARVGDPAGMLLHDPTRARVVRAEGRHVVARDIVRRDAVRLVPMLIRVGRIPGVVLEDKVPAQVTEVPPQRGYAGQRRLALPWRPSVPRLMRVPDRSAAPTDESPRMRRVGWGNPRSISAPSAPAGCMLRAREPAIMLPRKARRVVRIERASIRIMPERAGRRKPERAGVWALFGRSDYEDISTRVPRGGGRDVRSGHGPGLPMARCRRRRRRNRPRHRRSIRGSRCTPDNLRHNVAEIRRRAGGRPILAVIKNNGYGLGVVNRRPVARDGGGCRQDSRS